MDFQHVPQCFGAPPAYITRLWEVTFGFELAGHLAFTHGQPDTRPASLMVGSTLPSMWCWVVVQYIVLKHVLVLVLSLRTHSQRGIA